MKPNFKISEASKRIIEENEGCYGEENTTNIAERCKKINKKYLEFSQLYIINKHKYL